MWNSNSEQRPELSDILPTLSYELSLLKASCGGALETESDIHSGRVGITKMTNSEECRDLCTYFNHINSIERENALCSYSNFFVDLVDTHTSCSAHSTMQLDTMAGSLSRCSLLLAIHVL